jgi:hypothetical protein
MSPPAGTQDHGYHMAAGIEGIIAVLFAGAMAWLSLGPRDGPSRVALGSIAVVAFALGVRLLISARTGQVPRWIRRFIDSDFP